MDEFKIINNFDVIINVQAHVDPRSARLKWILFVNSINRFTSAFTTKTDPSPNQPRLTEDHPSLPHHIIYFAFKLKIISSDWKKYQLIRVYLMCSLLANATSSIRIHLLRIICIGNRSISIILLI